MFTSRRSSLPPISIKDTLKNVCRQPNVLAEIIEDYTNSPSKHVLKLFSYTNRDSFPKITLYCLGLFEEEKFNGVQYALDDLKTEQKNSLMNYWKNSKSQNEQYLYLYFLPFPTWNALDQVMFHQNQKQFSDDRFVTPPLPAITPALYDAVSAIVYADTRRSKNVVHHNFEGQRFSAFSHLPTDLRGVNLRKCDLGGSISRAGMSGHITDRRVHLENKNFSEANFTNANLTNAVLDGSDFTDAILKGTNFSGVDFSNVKILGMDMRESILDNEQLKYITGVLLENLNNPATQPLLDYFTQPTGTLNYLYHFFCYSLVPNEHTLTTLWLLGAHSKEELQQRINSIPASTFGTKMGRIFKNALDKWVENSLDARQHHHADLKID